MVFGVDEEDDAGYFGEVVSPESSCLGVAAEIEGGELYVTYRKLFRGCNEISGRCEN